MFNGVFTAGLKIYVYISIRAKTIVITFGKCSFKVNFAESTIYMRAPIA